MRSIRLCGLPYLTDDALGSVSLTDYAAYNAAIRAAAEKTGALYADLYAAQSSAPWTVTEDGSFSEVGNSLIAGEILKELFRHCICLSARVTEPLRMDLGTPATKTETALEAFVSASDEDSLKAACENRLLGLSLTLYHGLTSEQQDAVIAAVLVADRSQVDSFETADALFGAACMAVSRAEEKNLTPVAYHTYVAVGDSISYGYTAVDPKTDAWVTHFARLNGAAQGSEVTFHNRAVPGIKMCTESENEGNPPAKDTVQEFIVSYHPDLITVAYGVNDLNSGTALDDFINTYRSYLAEVKEGCPNATVIVCGLCAKGGDADSARIQQWNAAIKTLAEESGVLYCETYFDLRGIEWLLTDGLHPTASGYRVMANTLLRTLSARYNLMG